MVFQIGHDMTAWDSKGKPTVFQVYRQVDEGTTLIPYSVKEIFKFKGLSPLCKNDWCEKPTVDVCRPHMHFLTNC